MDCSRFSGNTPLASPPSAWSSFFSLCPFVGLCKLTGGLAAIKPILWCYWREHPPLDTRNPGTPPKKGCARYRVPSRSVSGCTVHGARQLVATCVKRSLSAICKSICNQSNSIDCPSLSTTFRLLPPPPQPTSSISFLPRAPHVVVLGWEMI